MAVFRQNMEALIGGPKIQDPSGPPKDTKILDNELQSIKSIGLKTGYGVEPDLGNSTTSTGGVTPPSGSTPPSESPATNNNILYRGGGLEVDSRGNISGDSTYKANSENRTNTGAGVAAATWENAEGQLEGGYNWDTLGTKQAARQYQQDALSQLQENIKQRQSIEEQIGVQQEAMDMQQYKNAQDAEKLGWTGGAVLDQNTKMEYMKASIAAQMYSAIELNKYAQDIGLAAARLSFELNQQEYALKYYQEAQQAAFNEAQITGTYFSPEVKDQMSQLSAAEQVLSGMDEEAIDASTDPEIIRARRIRNSINSWFETNNVSKEGVREVSAWNAEVSNARGLAEDLFNRYTAALNTAKTQAPDTDPTAYLMLDSNGQPFYEDGVVKVIDFDTTNTKDMFDYIMNENGEYNSQAAKQLNSYLDSLVYSALNPYEADLKNNKTIDYSQAQTALDNSINKKIKELKADASKLDNEEQKKTIESLLDNYTFSGSFEKLDMRKLKSQTTETEQASDQENTPGLYNQQSLYSDIDSSWSSNQKVRTYKLTLSDGTTKDYAINTQFSKYQPDAITYIQNALDIHESKDKNNIRTALDNIKTYPPTINSPDRIGTALINGNGYSVIVTKTYKSERDTWGYDIAVQGEVEGAYWNTKSEYKNNFYELIGQINSGKVPNATILNV